MKKKFNQIFVLLGFKFQSDWIYRRAVAEPAIIDHNLFLKDLGLPVVNYMLYASENNLTASERFSYSVFDVSCSHKHVLFRIISAYGNWEHD